MLQRVKGRAMLITENKEFKLGLLLAKRNQHLDAYDRFKILLNQNPTALPDILIPLYKHLCTHYQNLSLRILIAELLTHDEHYNDAILELEECLTIDPSYTQAYVLLSKIFRKKTAGPTTVPCPTIKHLFEQAFKAQIFDSTIIDLLSKIYLEENKLDTCINFFTTLLHHQPDRPSHYKTLAELYIKQHKYDYAAQVYQNISDLFPDESTEVANRCEQLVKYQPNNMTIRKILSTLQLKACNPIKASTHMNVVVLQEPTYAKDSITHYKDILSLSPNASDALFGLGKAFIVLNIWMEAVSNFEKLFETDPSYADVLITELNTILAHYPNQIMASGLLSELYVYKQNPNDALDALHPILDQDHQDFIGLLAKLKHIETTFPDLKHKATYLMALLCKYEKKDKDASDFLTHLENTDYSDKAVLLNAQIYIDQNALSKAHHALLTALAQHPNHADIHKKLVTIHHDLITQEIDKQLSLAKKADDTTNFGVGLLYLRRGDVLNALEFFQNITNNDGLLLKSYALIARCFMVLGRFDLAINQFDKILNNGSAAYSTEYINKIRYFQAISFLHNGNIQNGIESLERILEVDVNFFQLQSSIEFFKNQSVLNLRGKVLSGYYIGGAKLQILNVKNQENDGPFSQKNGQNSMSFGHQHNNEGVKYLLKQHYKAAEDEFKLAIQMEPNLTSAYINLSLLNLLTNHIDQANAYLAQAKKLNPNLDTLFLTQALLHTAQGEIDLALLTYKKVLETNPNNQLAMLNIGDLYWEKNDINLAYYYWKKASSNGLYFYLIRSRLGYLYTQSFSASHWVSDFMKPFPVLSELVSQEKTDTTPDTKHETTHTETLSSELATVTDSPPNENDFTHTTTANDTVSTEDLLQGDDSEFVSNIITNTIADNLLNDLTNELIDSTQPKQTSSEQPRPKSLPVSKKSISDKNPFHDSDSSYPRLSSLASTWELMGKSSESFLINLQDDNTEPENKNEDDHANISERDDAFQWDIQL